jgi:class 3 adenylate cyclase
MCGAQLAVAEVVPEEVRKTVTVVFSDLKGSTPLAERLDTEALREVLNQSVLKQLGVTNRTQAAIAAHRF